MVDFPVLRQTVLDAVDARGIAEFYRRLLGLRYRIGDEPPTDGAPDRQATEWLALRDAHGMPVLAVQPVETLPPVDWPHGYQRVHLDLTVPTTPDLERQHARALDLGATMLLDRSDDEHEPLYVYADPAGHPFCIFVAPGTPDDGH
ncbi:VOC family protein [Actinomycetospora sp. OC33-EN08]|uniref:VOC family protein n=2 Tax=Actinomycetospora aurantiaca TaxID=3129233 RepID=A0ABU8MKY3_9PSEU